VSPDLKGDESGNFGAYRMLILSELRRVSEKIDTMDGKLNDLRAGEISNLKVEFSAMKTQTTIMSAVIASVCATVLASIVAAIVAHYMK